MNTLVGWLTLLWKLYGELRCFCNPVHCHVLFPCIFSIFLSLQERVGKYESKDIPNSYLIAVEMLIDYLTEAPEILCANDAPAGIQPLYRTAELLLLHGNVNQHSVWISEDSSWSSWCCKGTSCFTLSWLWLENTAQGCVIFLLCPSALIQRLRRCVKTIWAVRRQDTEVQHRWVRKELFHGCAQPTYHCAVNNTTIETKQKFPEQRGTT